MRGRGQGQKQVFVGFGCLSLAGLLACGAPSPTTLDGGSESSGDPTETSTETETGSPACVSEACAETCGFEHSECGEALLGVCEDEGCVCYEQAPCPPCVEEQDCPYGTCTSAFGWCTYCVPKQLPIVLEPPESCEMLLPGYPQEVLPYSAVLFDGELLEYVNDCADEAGLGLAFTWPWPFEDKLRLCPEACLAFDTVAEASLRWWIPCE